MYHRIKFKLKQNRTFVKEKADLIGLFLFRKVELLAVTDFLLLGAGLGTAYYLLGPQKPKKHLRNCLTLQM